MKFYLALFIGAALAAPSLEPAVQLDGLEARQVNRTWKVLGDEKVAKDRRSANVFGADMGGLEARQVNRTWKVLGDEKVVKNKRSANVFEVENEA